MRYKKLKIIATLCATLGWLWFIFSNSLKSRSVSAQQSEGAESFLRRLLSSLGFSGDIESIAEIVVRKSAHVFEFFVLCILLYLLLYLLFAGRKEIVAVSAGVAAVCAATDETLQIFSHRGASVKDVLIDCIGVAAAVVLIYFVRKKHRKP